MANQRRHQLGPVRNFEVAHLEIDNLYRISRSPARALDAGGTSRNWDTVEYVQQLYLYCIGLTGVSLVWLTGTTGVAFPIAGVGTGTPPSQSAHYTVRIPNSWKAGSTVTLKWRFYNDTAQTGGDQKTAIWRINYNTPGASGVVGAVEAEESTTTLDTNQAQYTIKEAFVLLSNIVAGDLLNVTISFTIPATATSSSVGLVVLDCPWIEVTVQGIPDDGEAAS